MSLGKRLHGFYESNKVFIIMIPSIVALHWAWYRLQFNDVFVSPEARKGKEDLPIVRAYRVLRDEIILKKIFNKNEAKELETPSLPPPPPPAAPSKNKL